MFSVELLVSEEAINNKAHYFLSAQIRGFVIRLTPSYSTPEAAVVSFAETLQERFRELENRVEALENAQSEE